MKQKETSSLIHQKMTDAMMTVLKAMRTSSGPLSAQALERQRKSQDLLGHLVTPPIGFSWEPFEHNGLAMAWVRPERGHDPSKVILYCHGGGYITGNLGYARILAAKMSSATGREVLSFAYRLSPEFPWPAAQEDAMAAWDYLMHLGYGADQVVLAGDSAGGNMALVLALRLREQGRRLPGRLVLFSPWTDMTAGAESYQPYESEDPILSARYMDAVRQAYAPGQNWALPEFSPLFAKLAGLPPTMIQVGGKEILYADSIRLQQKMIQAGVACVLHCWPEMWHVFQTFPLPQSDEAMEKMAAFLFS